MSYNDRDNLFMGSQNLDSIWKAVTSDDLTLKDILTYLKRITSLNAETPCFKDNDTTQQPYTLSQSSRHSQ
jgi:hypothetical protein